MFFYFGFKGTHLELDSSILLFTGFFAGQLPGELLQGWLFVLQNGG